MVKMLKRMICLFVLLVLVPCTALAGNMVVDDANLFTPDEVQQIESVIQHIRDQYQMDAVVVTSYDVGYNDNQDFADLYYERGGYGLGEDQAGLLYLIDMRNRVPCIYTSGVMIDYITDNRLEELFDCSYNELTWGAYGDSALALLRRLESFLEEGRLEGSFRYDAQTGRRLSGLYNALTGSEMALAALAGILVAVVMALAISAGYNMKGGSFRCEQAADASRHLTRDDEVFLRQNVVRTRNVQVQSSGGGTGRSGGMGSSVHRSSSGGFHGGGVGRKF